MTDTRHSSKTDNALKMAVNPTPERTDGNVEASRPFGRFNLICMTVCLVMIVVGFALMAGPGSSAESGFNPDIFSTRRIVVGPAVAFLGFLFMAFAIIIRPDTLSRLRERRFCTDTTDKTNGDGMD